MKIINLYIEKFKNIEKMKINYAKEDSINIIIGKNATAKSNLLEAIVLIFRNLDINEKPPFRYIITYECRSNIIHIDADPNRRTRRYHISVNSERITLKSFYNSNRLYLPSNVFGYYSGISRRFKEHFDKHQEKFYKQLLDGEKAPLRPLFYARTVHSQYVLLSFFSFKDDFIPFFLREYFRISDFVNATFILKKPEWCRKENEKELFWGAEGVVRGFLENLYDISIAPIKLKERERISIFHYRTEERFYLRIENLEDLRKLASKYMNNVNFFKTLESTYISDLIHELKIKVHKEGVDESIEFSELSEGEQQLLAVLGLLRFTKENESLFLLDEPDTYLHPAWKLNYIRLINEVVGEYKTSQIMIVTHDPLILSGLSKNQINILRYDSKLNEIIARNPDEDPIGMGVNGILRSELFEVDSILDAYTREKLNRKKELVIKDVLTENEVQELETLDLELERMGFLTMFRDDNYTMFLKEMNRYELENRIVFDKEDKEKQLEITKKIIKKIRENQ